MKQEQPVMYVTSRTSKRKHAIKTPAPTYPRTLCGVETGQLTPWAHWYEIGYETRPLCSKCAWFLKNQPPADDNLIEKPAESKPPNMGYLVAFHGWGSVENGDVFHAPDATTPREALDKFTKAMEKGWFDHGDWDDEHTVYVYEMTQVATFKRDGWTEHPAGTN